MNLGLWKFCCQVRAVLRTDFNDSEKKSARFSLDRGQTVPILFSLHLIPLTVELVGK